MRFQDFVRVLHLWRIGITLVHTADLYHNGAHLEIFRVDRSVEIETWFMTPYAFLPKGIHASHARRPNPPKDSNKNANPARHHSTTISSLSLQKFLILDAIRSITWRIKEDVRRFDIQSIKIDSVTMNNGSRFILFLRSSAFISHHQMRSTSPATVQFSKYVVED